MGNDFATNLKVHDNTFLTWRRRKDKIFEFLRLSILKLRRVRFSELKQVNEPQVAREYIPLILLGKTKGLAEKLKLEKNQSFKYL